MFQGINQQMRKLVLHIYPCLHWLNSNSVKRPLQLHVYVDEWLHRIVRLVPGIRFASVQISYMGRQATISDTVALCLLTYSFMGWNPVPAIESTTRRYYHSPPAPCFTVSPVICRLTQWWNRSTTLSISPAASQILLLYKNTDCTSALHIYHRARTVSPLFSAP